MKKLIIPFIAVFALTACSQPEKVQVVEMSQSCQEYFDQLKQLAKGNDNLAKKFGDKLAQVDKAWQGISEQDRQQFTAECKIRNQQLTDLKGTPELEKLLNEL